MSSFLVSTRFRRFDDTMTWCRLSWPNNYLVCARNIYWCFPAVSHKVEYYHPRDDSYLDSGFYWIVSCAPTPSHPSHPWLMTVFHPRNILHFCHQWNYIASHPYTLPFLLLIIFLDPFFSIPLLLFLSISLLHSLGFFRHCARLIHHI